MDTRRYIKPEVDTIDLFSSEYVLAGYDIGEGSTPDQFGKGATPIDPDEGEAEMSGCVWDD